MYKYLLSSGNIKAFYLSNEPIQSNTQFFETIPLMLYNDSTALNVAAIRDYSNYVYFSFTIKWRTLSSFSYF
jgi:hypothetical protein